MRPIPITVLCIFMLLVGLVGLYFGVQAMFAIHPEALHRSALSWFMSTVMVLGTAVGLWRMRYWAFIFYAVLWLAVTAFALRVGAHFDWRSLVGPAIMALVLVVYWRRFGANNSIQRTRYARR